MSNQGKSMYANLKKYFRDESGAVTTDWVLVTGLAISLTIAVMAVISDGAEKGSKDMVKSATIKTNF